MSNSNSSSSTTGIFLSLLTVLFIGLKLAHVISWSWWWVLSPIWLTAALILGVLALVLLFVYFRGVFKKSKI